MARLSLPLILSSLFAATSVAQSPIPLGAITAPAGGSCPCFIVADVRGIIFGTQTVTQTDVVQVSTAVNKNGSAVVITTVFAPDQQFTLAPTGLVTAAPAAPTVFINTNGIIEFAGLTLSGPGAFDVFTAYTYITGNADASGSCVLSTAAPSTLPTPFTVSVPLTADLGAAAISAESSFGQFIALPTCSPGGANFGQQTQVPAVVVTVTSATQGPAFIPPLTATTIGGVTTTVTPSPSPSASSSSRGVASPSPTTTVTIPTTSTKVVLTTTPGSSTITVAPTIVPTYLPPGYGQTTTIRYSGAGINSQNQLLAWAASLIGIAVGFFSL